MPTLRFSPSARADLSDILDFIARDKPLAAAKWMEAIQEKCELIAGTPEFGEQRPEYGADIRSSIAGRFVIFYRPIANGIEVIRNTNHPVLFGARRFYAASRASCSGVACSAMSSAWT